MEVSKVKKKLEHLENLPALTFMNDEMVAENFINCYQQTHPDESQQTAQVFYERESLFFKKILIANPKLQGCTRFSQYACLMDIITNGMTFDPAMGLLYMQMRGFNTAGYGKPPAWEQRCENKLTAAGELNLRMQLGQIKYCDTPVIVYEGDVFRIGNNEKGKYLIWEANMTKRTIDKKIIASFIKLTRPDGSIDYSFLTIDDIERFKNASAKQNKDKGPNELYSSYHGGVDPGFLATKTIRHAFKIFPKARIVGTNTSLEDDPENETVQVFDMGNQEESNSEQRQDPGPSFAPSLAGNNNIQPVQENKRDGTVQLDDLNF